ncbi:fungal-specific transcription factor domain-domain-containing protein [Aspergillus welwitschiae]|uniref:Fungal-specific transcription factor domain-domain-containing protein n=1 Tax=Aspergillus welwitschiae TaxID=1341132 RepID=A0A3F3PLB8_9EURO|nr:fungal-specific transcription factor domain-domain-containing protein [Aspergillus welwitschiae]RDH27572.1 fungal-specific transcription factor domain-domain-containing protein [Aspergillus welwitschiae]
MEPAQPPRRVTRACDYCRKKRVSCEALSSPARLIAKQLKCTGQRPCLNCQLYRAECSTSEHPKGPENAGRKRKRPLTRAPASDDDETEERSRPAPVVEMAPDFDQYAQDLGLVFAPFWPSHSHLPNSLDELGGADDSVASHSYNHLPTPRLSAASMPLDLPPATYSSGHVGVPEQSDLLDHPLPPQSAHEFFLKKGPSDSKFIGMGSVGSTIFECLRPYSCHHGESMESTILNHLVRGIQHVDELALSRIFQTPPLPERDFAEQGVKLYRNFVHLLYPIMENQFFEDWRHLYNNPSALSAAAYSRFCLVVAIGILASPLRSNDNSIWEAAKGLQEQTWSLIDHVMANPFLESTQVLLLHTVFLLYCGKTGIAWTTCGMAVRTAQSLGLHQQTPPQLELSTERVHLRARLWSVAYTLDAFLSLSEGRPPATTMPPNLEVCQSISAPEDFSLTSLAIDQPPPGAQIHVWDIGLAMIANDVYLLLKDSNSSLHRALARIAELDARLLAWKEGIPMEFRPDQQILADDALYSVIAILHLKYHNLMRSIHWISITLSSEAPTGRPGPLGARVRSSEAICLASARSVIDILNSTSDQRIAGRQGGFVVQYCMAAIAIFYRQIMKHPNRNGMRGNLEHMRDGTLHIMSLYEGIKARSQFQVLFEEMLKTAEGVVQKMHTNGTSGI